MDSSTSQPTATHSSANRLADRSSVMSSSMMDAVQRGQERGARRTDETLRKATSARELQRSADKTMNDVWHRSPSVKGSPSSLLSPTSPAQYASSRWDVEERRSLEAVGPHSQSPSLIPRPTMQSGTRRSAADRTKKQSEADLRVRSSYQHGVPSLSTSQYAPQAYARANDSAAGKGWTKEERPGPVIGLGLSVADGRRQPHEKTSGQGLDKSLTGGGPGPSSHANENRDLSPSARSPVFTASGLPSAYTHRDKQLVESAYAPRSGALSDSLPSSMRFSNQSSSISPTKPLPFRREMRPFSGSSVFAQQQQQQQNKHFQSLAMSPSHSGASDRGGSSSGFGSNTAKRYSAMSQLTAPSPTSASSSQPPYPGSTTQPSYHRQDSSMTSSDGQASSPLFTPAGVHASASTSLTSLRDSSVSKARGIETGDQSSSRAGSSRTHFTSRIPTASRSTFASTSNSERGKNRHGGFANAPQSIRSFATDEQSTITTPSGSPADSHRIIALRPEVGQTSSSGHADSSSEPYSSVDHSNIRPGFLVPSDAFTHALSPIAGSSPGGSFRSPSSRTREAETFLLSHDHQEDRLTNSENREGVQRLSHDLTQRDQRDRSERQMHHLRTRPADEETTRDAERRYLLLQQLHLDELSSHAAEHSGWLDARNGCERVMLPRPNLRGRDSHASDVPRTPIHSTTLAAFERNRRQPASFSYGSAEAARAQALLATSQAVHSDTRNADRRIFHHRLPPGVPEAEQSLPASRNLEDRPIIPKRTSSRQGRRSRLHIQTTNDPNQTPVLTPNLLSDDDDPHDALTPDLATVVAQGQALDKERQKWREEHQRSIGAASGRQRTKSTRERSRKSELADARLSTRDPSAPLRHARSSPNLRQRAKLHESQPLPPPPLPDSPPVSHCFPHGGRKSDGFGQTLPSRMRSKSLENLSRLGLSAVAFAAPCLVKHRINENGKEKEKEENRRSTSTLPRRKSRSQTLSHYGPEKLRKPLPSESRVMYDQPFVIARQFVDQSTSPGIGPGPFYIRHSNWSVQADEPDVQKMPVNQYGAAISSPRPDIGQSGVTNEVTFSPAGRHATARGYHRPTSSDELAALLRAQRENKDGSTPQRIRRKPPQEIEADDDDEKDDDEKRRWSLGMSRFIAEQASGAPEEGDATTRTSPDFASLPVPPRRSRSRLGNSGNANSLSPSIANDGSDSQGHEKAIETKAVSRSRAKSSKANENLTPLQILHLESHMQPGMAFQTPPLQQPRREEGFFSHEAMPNASAAAQVAPQIMYEHEGESREFEVGLPTADEAASSSGHQNLSVTGDSQYSRGSSGRPSSDDSISKHSRELWNTDQHNEEEFSTLFFRRPEPTSEIMARSERLRQQSTPTSAFVQEKPRPGQHRGGSLQPIIRSHQEDDEVDTNDLYDEVLSVPTHAPPHAVLSPRSGHESRRSGDSHSAVESAWNDSSVADPVSPLQRTLSIQRQGDAQHVSVSPPMPSNARLGRVDRQAFEIRPDGRGNTFDQRQLPRITLLDGSAVGLDEEAEMSSEIMQRARLRSFTADVMLYPESTSSGHGSDRAAEEFITFSSPARPLPLELPLSNREGTSTSPTHLVPPRSTASRSSDSVNTGNERGKTDTIIDMVRSRVWPTPPNTASSPSFSRS